MDTEKMTFEDGSWWEFRTFLSHGTKAATVAASNQFRTLVEPIKYGEGGQALTEPQYDWDYSRWSAQPSTDAMLLHSTIGWSYGPVNQEVLDSIPDANTQYVIRRMNELYASPLVVTVPNISQNDSSLP